MKAMLKLSTLPENSVEPLDDNATDIGRGASFRPSRVNDTDLTGSYR